MRKKFFGEEVSTKWVARGLTKTLRNFAQNLTEFRESPNEAETQSVKHRHFVALGTDWLILGIFGICLAWAILMATRGWNNPLSEAPRQTQTAITSYYLMRGGPFLNYETPVLGAPWSVPFEFPLYQWLVAKTTRIFDMPLDQTGRFVSELFFVLSLELLWILLSEFAIRPIFRLVFLTLVLVSPEYLFWSRAFVIESTAVFFCLGYLLFVVRYIRTRNAIDAVLAGLLGAIGVLVKLTTFPSFALAAGLIYVAKSWPDLKQLKSRKVVFRHALALVMFVCFPLFIGWLWVRHSDQIKVLNVAGVHLTSAALRSWNFGTLAQRFFPRTWGWLLLRSSYLLGSIKILLLPLVGLYFARHRVGVALISIAGFLAAPLIFTNLHVHHNYYVYANGGFLIAAVAWSIVGLLEGSNWRKLAGLAIFSICILCSIAGYYDGPHDKYYEIQTGDWTQEKRLGGLIKRSTAPEDVLLIFGLDWSPDLAYYSERRALMWPKWMAQDMDDPEFQEALKRLGDRQIGALIIAKDKVDSLLLAQATTRLRFIETPAYEDSTVAMYLRAP